MSEEFRVFDEDNFDAEVAKNRANRKLMRDKGGAIKKSADRMARAIHAVYGDVSAVGKRSRGETTDWEIQDALREYIQLTGIKL